MAMSGHNRRRVVEDWIALIFWALQQNDLNYLKILSHYDCEGRMKEIRAIFAEALNELILHTKESHSECLSDIWMEFSGNELPKQFFTPSAACGLLAELTLQNPPKDRIFTVMDPCCGTGRMLIAASQAIKPADINRALFIALQPDLALCMMTGINMVLFNIKCHIFHGDVLFPDDCRGAWFTIRHTEMATLYEHPLERAKLMKLSLAGIPGTNPSK